MILDKKLMFSDAQALTATAVSTNVVDNGVATVLSASRLRCLLTLTAKGASTPTIAAVLQGSTDEAFTSPQTIGTTGTLSDPALGNYEIPVALHAPYRYYRVFYTLGGGGGSPTFTATAGLVEDIQSNFAVFA